MTKVLHNLGYPAAPRQVDEGNNFPPRLVPIQVKLVPFLLRTYTPLSILPVISPSASSAWPNQERTPLAQAENRVSATSLRMAQWKVVSGPAA